MNLAQAGPVRGAIGRKKKETIMAEYDKYPKDASQTSEAAVTEKQLGWAVKTLHNPKIRREERQCLLVLAGEILLGFLAQDHLESST